MTREDLKNYYNTQKWIDEQKELYEEQRVKAEELKAIYINGMPKPKNKTNYAIEELIDKYNEILEYMNKLQQKQNAIIQQLSQMDNSTYRLILFYKYIKDLEYEEIGTKIHYNYYKICRLHGYALNEFDKLDPLYKLGKKKQDTANNNMLL